MRALSMINCGAEFIIYYFIFVSFTKVQTLPLIYCNRSSDQNLTDEGFTLIFMNIRNACISVHMQG